jgi:hypothetical protein
MASRGAKASAGLAAKILIGLSGAMISSHGWAERLETPTLNSGDTWTYRETTEKTGNVWTQTHNEVTVDHATSSHIYYSSKQSGSTQAPEQHIAGVDWSRVRDVNGSETVINRALSFPLSIGKSWDVEYKELHPNKLHKSEQWSSRCVAAGNEAVQVPAGKFDALKIECEGKWTAELEPSQTVVQGVQSSPGSTTMVTSAQKTTAITASGRTYKAFWYVPKIKRWVKSIEEYYSNKGIRNERYSSELESYKVAD